MDAYTQKKLRGKKLAARAPADPAARTARPATAEQSLWTPDGAKRPLTSEGLVRAYQQEADRQKLLIKKAELTQSRLMFVREAFRKLCADEHFMTLLRAEGLETHARTISRERCHGRSADMKRDASQPRDPSSRFENDCVPCRSSRSCRSRALGKSAKSSRKYRQIRGLHRADRDR